MKRKVLLWLLVVILLLAAGAVALAQSGGGTLTRLSASYDLPWNTVDGGGEVSTGGGYTLSGTAGQPDAGILTGGGYTLGGGFWKGGVMVGSVYQVYLPCIMRSYP